MPALVSVIIPSYNHEKYIKDLIISIREQSYKNIEIIVIDDGSTDSSVELLKSLEANYNFKLITKNNEGLCPTINRGLDEALGEFIVIIASDDLMPPKRIEEQIKELSNSSFDAISGGMTIISEDSQILRYVKPLKLGEVSFNDMINKNLIFAPTVMFKAKTFTKFGKYDTQHVIEDYSMWLKILSKNGRIALLNYNWAYYRINPKLTRSKIDWYFKGLIQALSEYESNPLVKKAIKKNHLKYYIKLTLFNEPIQDTPIFHKLNIIQTTIISILQELPYSIKQYLQKYT